MRRCLLLLPLAFAACATNRAAAPIESASPAGHASIAVSTGGPFRSAIYVERVSTGFIVIDLGWTGATEALAKGLSRLGGSTTDVVAVFLTHSHRDHVAAWRSVRHAPFYVARNEVELLLGEAEHRGWITNTAEKLKASDLPKRGEVMLRPFASDTVVVFGADTMRVFMIPGHTAGSTAYLFRGKLFAGDAIAKIYFGPFVPALPGYSDDRDEARRSLVSLRDRLQPFTVRQVCTAHLACAAVNERFWRELLGEH